MSGSIFVTNDQEYVPFVVITTGPLVVHDLSSVCSKSKTTGATCGAAEFTPVFIGVRVVQSLVFCIVFSRSLLVILSCFFLPLYCLSRFDLRLLITPLVP